MVGAVWTGGDTTGAGVAPGITGGGYVVDGAGYGEVEDGSLVPAGLDALDERERQIVELRFFEEMTQSQIASEIGVSQMHVSRLLRRSLATMRGRIEEARDE